MMYRFYIPPDQFFANRLILEGNEAHHLLHVLHLARRKTASGIAVFDGAGNEALCAIETVSRRTVTLRPIQRSRAAPPPYSITLAQALPKSGAMDRIVEKAVELGARGIQPLLSDRSVVRLSAAEGRKKQARWREIAIAACKQCGNNWLPEIAPMLSATDFLRRPLPYSLKLIGSLQPDARPLRQILAELPGFPSSSRPLSALLLIGPEGDFTPAELNAAKNAACVPLSLGPLVLRSETAALAALATLAYELNLAVSP